MAKIKTTSNTRLGANYNKKTKTLDFKLFSKNASDVILCIFKEPKNCREFLNVDMQKGDNDIWFASVDIKKLNNLKTPVFYGFRLFGPNWIKKDNFQVGSDIGFLHIADMHHNRFNPNKIAYDPYSKELSHIPEKEYIRVNASNYKEDNSFYAPKSVFCLEKDVEIPSLKPRALTDEIIGEVHLKDLTALSNFREKGTYKGASKVVKMLKDMGFTMIEFLPLNEFDSSNNHWGYMSLSYFSLARRYAFDTKYGSAIKEFRNLIKAFHKEGLKVCLDVVYNHTGEAGVWNNNPEDVSMMSYTLIDNATYYKNSSDNYYIENSGCGNDFNVANKEVQDLIVDSLEFWARQGVDAFRFDLAVALKDLDNGSNVNFATLGSFAEELPLLLKKRGIKVNKPNEAKEGINLIAEPWMCWGQNAYQLGNFSSYWAEWNDISRKTIRANSLNPNSQNIKDVKRVLEGSLDIFANEERSINYVACHDGFSLNDLNSYDRRNPNTKDGDMYDQSSSYNNNLQNQENAIKKQIALVLISRGVPMFSVGDFVAKSKNGNNNSYNLDNDTNYINFSKMHDLKERSGRIFAFAKNMALLRKRYLTGEKSFKYYDKEGFEISEDKISQDLLIFKIQTKKPLLVVISKSENTSEIEIKKFFKKPLLIFDTTKDSKNNFRNIPIKKDIYRLESGAVAVFRAQYQ